MYLAEAHADDVWPLGYGINSPKTIEELWKNCDNFLAKHPNLAAVLDHVFADNMDNEFNELVGAWPESYFFADSKGIALWQTSVCVTGPQSLVEAKKYARSKDLMK